jgi:putative OPT family oligopeptide transporter
MASPAPAHEPPPPDESVEEPPEERNRTPEEIERHWIEHVYAGDHARQLTLRAVITGMILGGLMALSNLYISLKTGWSLGVTITAAILAFGVWTVLCKVFRWVEPFGALENNAMQSVASAAGYMTGGGTVAAIPALLLVTGYRFEPATMMIWIGTLAFLGVFVAIPLKRQLINVEQLRFPSGVASAETVKGLHAHGGEATAQARSLGVAGVVGAVVVALRDALKLFPEHISLFGKVAAAYTIQLETSLVMIAAGALMGIRAAMSQLVGSLLCYGVLAPWARSVGAITGELKYKNIVGWSVWIGSAMMLTSGLLEFALSWRSVQRAFADLARILRPGQGPREDDPLARVEVPMTWFVAGLAVFGPLAIALQRVLFGIPIWMGAIAVLLSMVIAIVAARSTGETDTTPTGAMGKLVQLIFGGLHPGSMTTNLMTAQASAGVAIHASDLLTDLKSGYLLGAKPRHQFFAQFFGVIAGSAVVVPAYLLLIPDASAIGEDKYPAPGAQSWAAVAKLLAKGVSSLHPTARWGLLGGALVGVLLVVAIRLFPKQKKWIPSPIALGLAFTMPAWNAISMALGALAAHALEKRRPVLAAMLVIPVASGLIAGESLIGVFIGMFQALK